MKKILVNIIFKNSTFIRIGDINSKDFEDDVRNRRVIIRKIVNNKLEKTIIPYESLVSFEFKEMEV